MHRAPPENANAAQLAGGGVAKLVKEDKSNSSYTTKPSHKSSDITIAAIEVSWRAQVRVILSAWRGRTKLHVREFHPGPVAGTWWPSKQGVALDMERLPDLLRALQDAEAVAIKKGFLPGRSE
jgi:hypothetical protein